MAISIRPCVAPFQIYTLLFLNELALAYTISIAVASSTFLLIGIGFLTSILINEHQSLTSLALNNPLTGLLNRRGGYYEVSIAISAAKRNKSSMSVIMIDSLLKDADKALYQAKADGRNCVRRAK